MKALDGDLRERIVRAVDRGEPMPAIAARFEVGYSTVKKLKYRRRDTGSTEPLTGRCGRKRALSPEESDRLADLVTEDASITLELLRAELGVSCCLTAIWNELRRRGFSHKKSRRTRPSSPGPMSPRNAGPGEAARSASPRGGSIPSGSCSSTRPGPRRT
jgi:transposase